MSGSPVAVRVGASLPDRWLLPRVRQHSALSAVSWRSDLHGAANTQQLRRQNFCSRWTSLVELSSGPAAQFRHHLRTVQTTAEGTPFFGKHDRGALWLLTCSALEKHLLTYLLTYWLDVGRPQVAMHRKLLHLLVTFSTLPVLRSCWAIFLTFCFQWSPRLNYTFISEPLTHSYLEV